ncbi:MAG: EAL domain-containing protein [Deltaproteobacteria bacterium]|nr:EAL domain-containing protein [Deltaproteobacteria bacterium]
MKQPLSTPGGPRVRRPSRIPGVLRSGDIQVVYQPLIDLRTNRVFAYEALVRSTSPEFKSPPALLTEAINADCCGALGRQIREVAIAACPDHPLFINIHPNEFDEGWLVQPDDPIFAHDHAVYLEITESVPLSHFHHCHSLLNEVRSKGAYLAVDDLGAGYSNLKYIADLKPEIVKLDRALTAQIDVDRRQRLLVAGLVRLCVDLGARVVAEGLETQDQARAALDTGVHLGQGFVLARPSFPPPIYDHNILSSLYEPMVLA